MKVPDTPKSRGIDRIVSTPPAPLAAGWPAPLVNHSAAFYVGYYTKDTLPPPYAPVTWLPLNLTMSYLVRFAAPCTGGINVTVTMTGMAKSEGGDPLQVRRGLAGRHSPPPDPLSHPHTLPAGARWRLRAPRHDRIAAVQWHAPRLEGRDRALPAAAARRPR